jgi:hypothetical protein
VAKNEFLRPPIPLLPPPRLVGVVVSLVYPSIGHPPIVLLLIFPQVLSIPEVLDFDATKVLTNYVEI